MAEPIQTSSAAAARRLMPSLETSARGMSVEQRFLEIISRNIANAQTTRTAEGGPYRRQIAVAQAGAGGVPSGDIEVREVDGRLVYDPGHPDANDEGFVEYPGVEVESELIDLMLARRLYEANATVFQAAKSMLKRAMDI